MIQRSTLFLLACAAVACGGGTSLTTPSTPPVTSPPATTPPTTQPAPVATPDPNCDAGLCEAPITNTRPPIGVNLRLYQLFNPGGEWILPTPNPTRGFFSETFKVGQTLRLDVTGRDDHGDQTLGRQNIQWIYEGDDGMFTETNLGPFQRKLRLAKAGNFRVYVIFDGLGSNDLNFRVSN